MKLYGMEIESVKTLGFLGIRRKLCCAWGTDADL